MRTREHRVLIPLGVLVAISFLGFSGIGIAQEGLAVVAKSSGSSYDVFFVDDAGNYDGRRLRGERMTDPFGDLVTGGDTCSICIGGDDQYSTFCHQSTTGFLSPVPLFSASTSLVSKQSLLRGDGSTAYVLAATKGGVVIDGRSMTTRAVEISASLSGPSARADAIMFLIDAQIRGRRIDVLVGSFNPEQFFAVWAFDLDDGDLVDAFELDTNEARSMAINDEERYFIGRSDRGPGNQFLGYEIVEFDGAGNEIATVVPASAGISFPDTLLFDAMGRLWFRTEPSLSAFDLDGGAIVHVLAPPTGYSSLNSNFTAVRCVPDDTSGRLQNRRFRVTVAWRAPDGSSGQGHFIPAQSEESAEFWFFNPENTEIIVKILNACGFSNHYWVFAGGLTNVAVTLTVEDTLAGVTREYRNPMGTAFQPVQDTTAFATCP